MDTCTEVDCLWLPDVKKKKRKENDPADRMLGKEVPRRDMISPRRLKVLEKA